MNSSKMAEIEAHIRDMLKNRIGDSNSTVSIQDIKQDVLKNLPKDASKIDVDVRCAWGWMNTRTKIKWFIFNRWPFKNEGAQWRRDVERQNELIRALYSELGEEEYSTVDLPLFLIAEPKGTVISRANITLPRPLRWLDVQITVPVEKQT